MEEDLFAAEQKIFDNAVRYSLELRNGTAPEIYKYDELASDYGKLLKQLRMVTKISDWTAESLHTSMHDLLDIVHLDVMTGVYNRKFMEDSMERIAKSLMRRGGSLGIMMIDVDHFKRYNDTYGHSKGDSCLKAIAKAIQSSLFRPDDFVVRYGGEEFVVVMPDSGETAARVVANRVIDNVRLLDIPHEKSKTAEHVTISVGVTVSQVTNIQDIEEYIKRADQALYHSKNTGRDRYTYMDPEGAEK